jgi:hypothetical protein
LKSDVWLPGHIEMPVRLFMSTTPHYWSHKNSKSGV